MNFWWDAINTHKISPRGMPAYDRNEASAVFTSDDAAFTVADSVYYSSFNDPQKSKVAGKVAISYFPLGQRRKEYQAWNDIWGWAIPKSISPERKALVKRMLNDMMVDEEGQIEMFKKTGTPPPNKTLWPKIAKDDEFMRATLKYILDVPNKVRSAYYFERCRLPTRRSRMPSSRRSQAGARTFPLRLRQVRRSSPLPRSSDQSTCKAHPARGARLLWEPDVPWLRSS